MTLYANANGVVVEAEHQRPEPHKITGFERLQTAKWPVFDERLVIRIQEGRCYLCGKEFRGAELGKPLPRLERPTHEHVVPKKKGGRRRGNILIAHGRCNCDKGSRWPYPCELIYLEAVLETVADYHAWLEEQRQEQLTRDPQSG